MSKRKSNKASAKNNWTIVVDSSMTGAGVAVSEAAAKSAVKRMVGSGSGALRSALRGSTPGGWSSNHRAEAEHYTGWDFVAVRAVALQFAQAACNAYQDGTAKQAQVRRTLMKSNRNNLAALARIKADYNMAEDESTLMDADAPLVKLLRRPNPIDGGAIFRFKQLQQLSLTGTALVWNVPNKAGLTVERWVIPTGSAQPMAPTPEYPRGYYRITPEISRWYDDSGEYFSNAFGLFAGAEIPAQQVQVYRWPHPIVLDDGQSTLAATALWTDTANMLDRRRWSHMRKGANPSVAISYEVDEYGNAQGPEDESQLERVQERFEKKYSGPDNDGAAMFLTGGAKVNPLGHTAVEMDYVASFDQMREAKLAAHQTPPIAVGVESPTGREGLYAPLLAWIHLSIQPQLDIVAEQDTIHLAPQFGPNITVEYIAAKIDDSAPLEEQLKTDLAAGAIEVDELRVLRGRKPWGDIRGQAIAGAMQRPIGLQFDREGVRPLLAGQSQTDNPLQQLQQLPQLQQAKPGATTATDATGATGDAGINAQTTLNGAQIESVISVIVSMQQGVIAEYTAVELLVAVGIDRAKAVEMIKTQAKIPPPETDQENPNNDLENLQQSANGKNGSAKFAPHNRVRKFLHGRLANGNGANGASHFKDYP